VIASSGLALPQGYTLNEYRIESTLGIGGFGLTYLATDANLNLQVAIKEYLPGEFALRCEDQSVKPKSDSTVDTFKWGLSRFLDESRTLASFRHPNIVRVMRFFEANQTAYMVMEFVAGKPLHEWTGARRPLTEQAILSIADPLLEGLEVIHRAKYLHRDIKPNNIFIREDSSPVLIDFGSARLTGTNTDITSIVTPGYAPFEQYHSQGNQGPWSDIYSFGAVLYWMVTGNKPAESVARIRQDVMLPAAKVGDRSRYSSELLGAIDWALAPMEEARPQSVAEFRKVLRRLAPLPAAVTPTELVAPRPSPGAAPDKPSVTPPTAFDRETLERIDAALAPHIGPIASRVVRSVARKAVTLAQLVESVAVEIADDKARAAFVKKFAGREKSAPAAAPASVPSGATTLQPGSAPQRFDPATLAKAEAALAKYIGAVARVVVKRAAAGARDETEFYLLLAEQIEDKNERKAFVKMAVSASGRE
jgi:serine/threonine protein kinase